MANETLWMIECDQVREDFEAGRINEVDFTRRMSRLGFDGDEISEHLEGLAV